MSNLLQIFGSILLALVPVIIWGQVFYKKSPEKRRQSVITFIAGSLAVIPILLYKASWTMVPALNIHNIAAKYNNDFIGIQGIALIPLSIIITFMVVGLIEEVMKLLAVKSVDSEKYIHDIDDSIEFFIIAALGFSFTENILYFYSIWIGQGVGELLIPFFFRSSFSTLAHLIFSGILGYYYGTAHFAGPVLTEEIKNNRKLWARWLHRITNIRKEKLFYQERIIEGLVVAISLHALFNIFLEMEWSILIIPFLFFGYLSLSHLLSKKESHIKYGKLLTNTRNH